MNCYFDGNNRPKVEVTVVGLDDQVEVATSIDTGFDGALALSLPVALSIGLKLSSVLPVELADGSVKREYVFAGSVILEDHPVPVEVFLTTSEESLLGTALLQEQRLTIDFPRRLVSITSSAPKGKALGKKSGKE